MLRQEQQPVSRILLDPGHPYPFSLQRHLATMAITVAMHASHTQFSKWHGDNTISFLFWRRGTCIGLRGIKRTESQMGLQEFYKKAEMCSLRVSRSDC